LPLFRGVTPPMGIHDRDYYRNEGPSIFDTLMPRGLVCRWLIGINVGVFCLQVMSAIAVAHAPDGKEPLVRSLGLVTDWLILDVNAVAQGEVWRLLTYAFLHAMDSWFYMHLIFNMLCLWWFGSSIEELYGRKEFLAIYLVSAVLGGIAFEAWGLAMGGGRCLGASGAVTTMLVLCAFHYPHRIIYVMMVVPMPIWLFAILNVLQDSLFLVHGGTRVAVVVHLAGAAFAWGYYKWQHSIIDVLSGFPWLKLPRSRPGLKLYDPDADKPEPVAVSAPNNPAFGMDEHLEAKLDALLEKIAKNGKDSLTPKEQEILKQASEMYKRRRT
jgi:membrane associated rhomboid family serine protease